MSTQDENRLKVVVIAVYPVDVRKYTERVLAEIRVLEGGGASDAVPNSVFV